MGGLRYSDRKRWVEFVKKGNSQSFKEVLKVFYEEIVSEWVEAGNKKAEMLKEIEIEMPNIQLEYLPEYSPDYNLIELVWHSAKEDLSHRFFKSVEELEAVLHKLLNQGELIIK